MSEILEAEVIESVMIELTQAPIIKYDLVEAKGLEVKAKIESLKLDTIEPTEDNLSILKTTRADLNKDFATFEEQRKLVKDMVMKPYNEFESKYKEFISSVFTNTDTLLKDKISYIDGGILVAKVDKLKEYFNDKNTFDFLKFEDMGLKIIKSNTDKNIMTLINSYLGEVENALNTIETLPNKDRVLAKYQLHKDLNRAISETNIEMQREAEIKAKQEEQKAKVDEVVFGTKEREAIQSEASDVDNEIYEMNFKVYGTKTQLKAIKNCLNEIGVKYE